MATSSPSRTTHRQPPLRVIARVVGYVLFALVVLYIAIATFFADTELGFRLGLSACPPGSVEIVRGDDAESYCVPFEDPGSR